MKKIVWDNKNKMHMESGFKTFDRQTNLITKGNAWLNTQLSSYVLKENNYIALDMFRDMPYALKEYIKTLNVNIILYEFFHYNSSKKMVDGYVITDIDYNYMYAFIIGTYKSKLAIDECMKYICN